jgi:hypothetical protein
MLDRSGLSGIESKTILMSRSPPIIVAPMDAIRELTASTVAVSLKNTPMVLREIEIPPDTENSSGVAGGKRISGMWLLAGSLSGPESFVTLEVD